MMISSEQMSAEPDDPPSFSKGFPPGIRITDETMVSLLNDHSRFDDLIIIDCRSKSEYDGGHIKDAIRCCPFDDENNISKLYDEIWKPKTLFIFYCEYSEYRGPTGSHFFREAHRNSKNKELPVHTFVLDGGYSSFYSKYRQYCDGGYVKEPTKK